MSLLLLFNQGEGWLSGWQYRKTLTLKRTNGALSNHIAKIRVGETSSSPDHDVHCNGHVQSDFRDLRFTNAGGDMLNYWIESIVGNSPSSTAIIWIQFDYIGTSDTTFYMYYGNSGASAYSNRESTFPTWKDFEQDEIGSDPSGITDIDNVWSVQDDSGNRVYKNSGDGSFRWTIPSLTANYVLRFKVKYYSGTYNRWQVQLRKQDSNNFIFIGCISDNNRIDIYEKIDGTEYQRTYANYTYGTSWHDVEVVFRDGCIAVRIGSTEIKYENLSITSTPTENIIFNANSGSINGFDNLHFIATDNELDSIIDDDFTDGDIGSQWTIDYGSISGVSFQETGGELQYSGTPSASGYINIRTSYLSRRYGLLSEIKFKAPTGIQSGTDILFRIDSDGNNYVEIRVTSDGYYLRKCENGNITATSATSLFGNETTTFHTLKLLWDEFDKVVWGWVDNQFLGSLSVNISTFPDRQRFIIHINNASGSSIDRRFDDFIIRTWRNGEPEWGEWGAEEMNIISPMATQLVIWI